MNIADYRTKLAEGRYKTLGAAKKALGRSKLSEEEMTKANKLADKHFAAAAGEAPVVAKTAPAKAVKAAVKSAAKAAVSAAPVKRGPGRPKKEDTVVEVPVKRGRGRPRKADVVAPPVKRGPGRPKKNALGRNTWPLRKLLPVLLASAKI